MNETDSTRGTTENGDDERSTLFLYVPAPSEAAGSKEEKEEERAIERQRAFSMV